MREWPNRAVSKTVVLFTGHRGFESHSLRQEASKASVSQCLDTVGSKANRSAEVSPRRQVNEGDHPKYEVDDRDHESGLSNSLASKHASRLPDALPGYHGHGEAGECNYGDEQTNERKDERSDGERQRARLPRAGAAPIATRAVRACLPRIRARTVLSRAIRTRAVLSRAIRTRAGAIRTRAVRARAGAILSGAVRARAGAIRTRAVLSRAIRTWAWATVGWELPSCRTMSSRIVASGTLRAGAAFLLISASASPVHACLIPCALLIVFMVTPWATGLVSPPKTNAVSLASCLHDDARTQGPTAKSFTALVRAEESHSCCEQEDLPSSSLSTPE